MTNRRVFDDQERAAMRLVESLVNSGQLGLGRDPWTIDRRWAFAAPTTINKWAAYVPRPGWRVRLKNALSALRGR